MSNDIFLESYNHTLYICHKWYQKSNLDIPMWKRLNRASIIGEFCTTLRRNLVYMEYQGANIIADTTKSVIMKIIENGYCGTVCPNIRRGFLSWNQDIAANIAQYARKLCDYLNDDEGFLMKDEDLDSRLLALNTSTKRLEQILAETKQTTEEATKVIADLGNIVRDYEESSW